MNTARLIIDPPIHGATNMANDEALLRCTAASSGNPVLRFYQWQEPTLSLGYFQEFADRQGHLPSQNCAAVRRSTGGGAILHHHEWTYSLVLPAENRFHGSRVYQNVHGALIDTLSHFDVRCALAGEQRVKSQEPFLCFERRSSEDVVCQGCKVLGSAQRRVGSYLLQHGSLILKQSEFAPEIRGVEGAAKKNLPAEEIRDAWIVELERRWNWTFVPSEWTHQERYASQKWRSERFEQREWLQKR